MIAIHVTVQYAGLTATCTLQLPPSTPVSQVVHAALGASEVGERLGMEQLPDAGQWTAYHNGAVLSQQMSLEEAIPGADELSSINVRLVCRELPPAAAAAEPLTFEESDSAPPFLTQAPEPASAAASEAPEPPRRRQKRTLTARAPASAANAADEAVDFLESSMLKATYAEEPRVEKHFATARYYHRMIPHRQYDFSVVISKESLSAYKTRRQTQTESHAFEADEEEPLEVELVLPGCYVYALPETPTWHNRAVVRLEGEESIVVRFSVIPYARGTFKDCQAVVYSGEEVAARIPLEIIVRPTTVSYALGVAGVVVPLFFDQIMAFASRRCIRWFGFGPEASAFPSWLPWATAAVLLFSAAAYFYWRIAPRQGTSAAEL